MPINYADYPANWREISRYIRFERTDGVCEGSPAYPDCGAIHGELHPVTSSKVVLTVAHLDHDTSNNDFDNLKAWCQRCHNTYDAPNRKRNIARRLRREQIAAGQMEMEL